MTDLEAIDRAVEISGVERYRYLALGHPNPTRREEYTRYCRSIATGEPIEPAPKQRPGILTQIGTATRAAVGFARDRATVPADVLASRRAICAGCEHSAADGRCDDCGCVLALKLPIPSQFCGLGKWGAHRPAGRGCGGCGSRA